MGLYSVVDVCGLSDVAVFGCVGEDEVQVAVVV
jgi:hypothetical protein